MNFDSIKRMTDCNNTNTAKASGDQILGKNLSRGVSFTHLFEEFSALGNKLWYQRKWGNGELVS